MPTFMPLLDFRAPWQMVIHHHRRNHQVVDDDDVNGHDIDDFTHHES